MDDNHLELVSTDDLVDELLSRYDHFMFYGIKDGKDPTRLEGKREFCGEPHMIAGMAARISREALDALEETATELDEFGDTQDD